MDFLLEFEMDLSNQTKLLGNDSGQFLEYDYEDDLNASRLDVKEHFSNYWDDLVVEQPRSHYLHLRGSLITTKAIFDHFINPVLIVVGFLLNFALILMSSRRSIRRYHYTFSYYLALSVVNILSLILQCLHLYNFYSEMQLSKISCKLLIFTQHCVLSAYGYVISALAFERCLVAALIYREKFEQKQTNVRTAVRRELVADWLGSVVKRFCNQWSTTLTIVLIFIGIALNNLWVWWVYTSFGTMTCEPMLGPEGEIWYSNFRLALWFILSVFFITCNIVLIYYRIKTTKLEKERRLEEASRPTRVPEINSVSGGGTIQASAAEFCARVQTSYATEFSGRNAIEENGERNLVENDSRGDNFAVGVGWVDPWSSPTGSINPAWEQLGEPRPQNNNKDFRAVFNSGDQAVEISSPPQNLETSNSGCQPNSRVGRLENCGIIDALDSQKQDLLTKIVHGISVGLLASELPTVIVHIVFRFVQYWSPAMSVTVLLMNIITLFLLLCFYLSLPIIVFCLHRVVILREARVIFGEIKDLWGKVTARARRPTLFDRGIVPDSQRPASEREELVLDMESIEI